MPAGPVPPMPAARIPRSDIATTFICRCRWTTEGVSGNWRELLCFDQDTSGNLGVRLPIIWKSKLTKILYSLFCLQRNPKVVDICSSWEVNSDFTCAIAEDCLFHLGNINLNFRSSFHPCVHLLRQSKDSWGYWASNSLIRAYFNIEACIPQESRKESWLINHG